MFSGKCIAFSLVVMIVSIIVFSKFQESGNKNKAKLTLNICLISSIYCLLAGIFLSLGWEDPLAQASSGELVKASITHGGRGGIVIFAIRYWPYLLIGLGGYFCYNIFQIKRA